MEDRKIGIKTSVGYWWNQREYKNQCVTISGSVTIEKKNLYVTIFDIF